MKSQTDEILAILRNLHKPDKWKDSRWLRSYLVKNHLSLKKMDTPSGAFKSVLTKTLGTLSETNEVYGAILRGRYWDGLSVHQMLNKEPHYWQERNFYVLQDKAVLCFTTLLLEEEAVCQQVDARRKVLAGLTGVALLAGIIVMIILIFFLFSQQAQSLSAQPTLISPPSATLETPDLSGLLENAQTQTVFAQNFENTWADDFTNRRGMWDTVSDGAANRALDVNSMDTFIEYPVLDFGNPNWRDFVLETRIKIVEYTDENDAPLASIRFRGHYKIAFTPYWKSIELVFDPPWEILSARTIAIEQNTWHTLVIYAAGRDVYVFLDGDLILKDVLKPEYAGDFGFATWPGAHVQFDDLRILQIETP